MNTIETILSIIESKATDDGLRFRNQLDENVQCKKGEVMISEFEKLFKAQRSYRSSDKEAFIRGCEAAYQHQQSKVDELQKKLDEYIFVAESIDEMYVREVKKNNEMKNRFDKAIEILSSKKKKYVDMFIELDQVIRGGEL